MTAARQIGAGGSIGFSAMATDDIERIRSGNDIVALISEQVELKKSGQNYLARCPFHADRTPSLIVSPAKQLFHCFGCGVGGDLFEFFMRREGISFPEAAERLAVRAGIAFEKRGARKPTPPSGEAERLHAVNAAAAAHFQKNLQGPQGAGARAYLKSRGVTDETVRTFGIGYAPPKWDHLLQEVGTRFPSDLLLAAGLVAKKEDASSGVRFYDRFRNRLLFPIRSQTGEGVGFGGRALDDTPPKYLNTPETAIFSKGHHLFGLDRVVQSTSVGKGGRGPLIVMEGYFDAVAAHQAGFTRTVATMGTALTPEQATLVRRLTDEVVLVFDPDEAGVRATYRAAVLFLSHEVPTRVAALPAGEDPDLFIRRAGASAFSERLAAAVTPIDYFAVRWADPLAPIQKKVAVAEEIFVLIRQMKTRMEQGNALQKWATASGMPESDLRAEFLRGKKASPLARPTTRPLTASFPKDEASILSGLLTGRLDPATLNGQIHPDDFTHPEVRKMIEPFWRETRWQRPDAAIGPLSDSTTEEAADAMAQETQDAVAALRARRLDRESAGLAAEIKQCEADGRQDEAVSLQARLVAIRRERRLVSMSAMSAPHR